ncbi:MAG TPA: hypothetical protein IAB48_10925 [Candidatus Fimimorpha excrementavium]|nr:hypothetical protein [Candidatus Fimimorpha excrementavium]
MRKVTSRVKMNMPKIKQLTQAQVAALEQTAETLHGEVKDAQVVPMKTGNLSGEAFFCDYSESNQGKVSLVHSTPYARRLYFHPEYHFNKEFHENARGEWFEDWLPGGKNQDFAQKAFKEFYRRLTGV